jgi:Family of unknown function (DUF1028)
MLESAVEGSMRAFDCVPSSRRGALSVKGMVATYSIVAFDPETKALGVAVQSKFLAVGSIVPWARAGAGAVATQAMANFNYGPRGLDLMSRGTSAEETIRALISSDDERDASVILRFVLLRADPGTLMFPYLRRMHGHE